jgi:hypothetical protein
VGATRGGAAAAGEKKQGGLLKTYLDLLDVR